jgi:membrane-bound lytic murein transglycosylase B
LKHHPLFPVPVSGKPQGLGLLLALALLAGCATQPPPGKTAAGTPPAASPATANLPPLAGSYWAGTLSGDYAGYPAMAKFIERMSIEQGYPREYLNGLFSQARRKQWTIEYMNRQAPTGSGGGRPSTGSWARYRDKFLDEVHIGKGAKFWLQHEDALQQAQERYGVPPEIIMGIMGVETLFGSNVGKDRILDALTTLAFDYPRRADYFTEELANFLTMTRREGLDPTQPVGSFAGAMGLGQFMPGSFLRWGVDFDNDGRCNLWDAEDAIGSIANYFVQHGWQPNQPVATPTSTTGPAAASLETGFDTHYPMSRLNQAGIQPLQACPLDDPSLLLLRGNHNDEYWLGHKNFYVLTRYNHSTHYAMAVYQLAQAIKSRYRSLAGQR